jgi:hypothetical protein
MSVGRFILRLFGRYIQIKSPAFERDLAAKRAILQAQQAEQMRAENAKREQEFQHVLGLYLKDKAAAEAHLRAQYRAGENQHVSTYFGDIESYLLHQRLRG